jgi:hypothetical protein
MAFSEALALGAVPQHVGHDVGIKNVTWALEVLHNVAPGFSNKTADLE